MHGQSSHSEVSVGKTRAKVGPAFIGLLAAAVCLIVFVSCVKGSVAVAFDILFFYFLVCVVGAGIGLIFVYRLIPQRGPILLSLDSGGVPIQPMTRAEISVQTEGHSRNSANAAVAIPGESEQVLIAHSDRRQSISRYKTPEGGGLIGLIAMIGMAIVLMIGSNFARQFLSLAIPAGGAIALVLSWGRRWKEG